MIALPGFQYAGMEHWGLVSYSENSMLLSEEMASINDKEAVTRVIAHETAHMVRLMGLHGDKLVILF